MANQYYDSFKCVLEQRYKKSYIEVLQDFSSQGFTVNRLSKTTGFDAGTIRKWIRRANAALTTSDKITFKTMRPRKDKSCDETVQDHLQAKAINLGNCLSRKWG
ncbi:hypothetical protein [Fangia hongkongensis]|uniref:hypothetical protein n=1 Tax=Fangia hongkongensis TaxID=270495 RepID=UPI000380D12D|nr:hypothetical protein [Fangia hongkongensis]MBK2124458.1 hypothetical protein [Fangia hongkongensis]